MATPIKTVNTTQAAALLNVQPRTFRRICEREGITPLSYKSNEVLYRSVDVNRLLRMQQRATNSKMQMPEQTTNKSSGVSSTSPTA